MPEIRVTGTGYLNYECELARRRYMAVDPDNRLVASSLEADWNQRMRELRESQEELKRQQAGNKQILNELMHTKIKQLAADFSLVWNHTRTEHRERKRMIRLLVEDVTVRKQTDTIMLYIRFKGGKTQTLEIPKIQPHCDMIKIDKKVVSEIDRLLENHTNSEIADILNSKSLASGTGKSFDALRVRMVYRAYTLKSHYARLRDRGCLTGKEIEQRYGICRYTVVKWRKKGILSGHKADDQNQYLYEDPGLNFKYIGRRTFQNEQK